MYGKKTLLKNEMMNLTAEIPSGDNLTGKYELQLEYKNQHGDIYVKKVFINMGANVLDNVEKFWQGKSELDKEDRKMNVLQESKRRK